MQSDTAANRLKVLLSQKREDAIGIRIGVKKRGCSGLSYTLDYAKEPKPKDEIVEQQGIKIFIDPQALMTVTGTKMDFQEDHLKAEFVFLNPNAKSFCGCGESFNV
jgi:iron-sulfur cluster assembly protein